MPKHQRPAPTATCDPPAGAPADAFTESLAGLSGRVEQPDLDSGGPSAEASGPPPSGEISQDAELLQAFVEEAQEHVASIEAGLLELERNPENLDTIHATFRACHTIKGVAGFLDLVAVRDLAHELETLLDYARNGSLTLTASINDVILEGVDVLKAQVRAVEAQLAGNPVDLPAASSSLMEALRTAHVLGAAGDPGGARSEPVAPVAASPVERAESRTEEADPKAAVRGSERLAVRVDADKLDYLLDMVGEMVIAQTLLRHDPDLNLQANPRILANLNQLTRVTEEVQKTAMATRLVPVETLFKRVARLVRDLARRSGKPLELVTEGGDTELDKTIVEELVDPLMHMVRNAVDHGIECAEDRAAAGKPPVAEIRLRASRQADHIQLDVCDDGRGLNREKILNKARQRGLVDPDASLTDQEVFNLIFEPGFSTAEKVTDLSGRGVGMDVVRRQIQKLRGRVVIESLSGRGTTFRLRLPLSLAIIDGLVVGIGDHRYIVPIFAVQEMLRPAPEDLPTVGGRGEMVLVRDQLLPVLRLGEASGLIEEANDALRRMVASMNEISSSSGKISKIIRVIDEIAFQTNILALNAAVEAARAGEAGMGFAVVADEVRSLAQRSAQAASDTTQLIEESIRSASEGKRKLDEVARAIGAVTDRAKSAKGLVDHVHVASQEQERGIEQIAKSVARMGEVTQQVASTAEQSASAGRLLREQASSVDSMVASLRGMVGEEVRG
jgi:two-component system chemotaxis sensor kinase CheA